MNESSHKLCDNFQKEGETEKKKERKERERGEKEKGKEIMEKIFKKGRERERNQENE